MAVEKFRLTKESNNYTIISNSILQKLNNYEALGLYCYLCSLPDNWIFYKDQLMKHGNMGRDKLAKLLKILKECQLIDYGQIKNEKGQYEEWQLHVKNGSEFKPTNQDTVFQEPVTEKPLTANQLLENSTYKRNIEKENKDKKERESTSEKSKASLSPISDDFYPDFERLKKAQEVSQKCGISIPELIIKFKNIAKEKDWTAKDWNLKFENFLINEKPSAISSDGLNKYQKPVSSHGAYQEYGPGHPHWETVQAVKRKKNLQAHQ